MDKTSISSVNKKVEDNMAERMISEVGLKLTRTMKNEAVHSLVETKMAKDFSRKPSALYAENQMQKLNRTKGQQNHRIR